MGRHLGNIGTARPVHDETFNFLDEPDVRVHPDLSNLLLVDFMIAAEKIDADDDPQGATKMTRDLFTGLVHPDDFDRFWAAARRGRQQVKDLMVVAFTLMEELSERPTKRRSTSSTGRRTTGQKSRGDSSSRVIQRLERQGRPDLAVIVRDAQRAG